MLNVSYDLKGAQIYNLFGVKFSAAPLSRAEALPLVFSLVYKHCFGC